MEPATRNDSVKIAREDSSLPVDLRNSILNKDDAKNSKP